MKATSKHRAFRSHRQELLYRLQDVVGVLEELRKGRLNTRHLVEVTYNARASLARFGVTKEKPLIPRTLKPTP